MEKATDQGPPPSQGISVGGTPTPSDPMKTQTDPANSPLHADQVNRLWQHGMHEERLFHDRLNYFSAVQTGLLGVFAILYHKEPAPGVFAPLAAIGLIFALLWLRIQVRHWQYCVLVHKRLRSAVPEYSETIAAFAAPGRADGLSIARPLAYAVPLLFAAIWVFFFTWVLLRASW